MPVIELPLAAAQLFVLAGLTTCPPAQQNPRVEVAIQATENPAVTNLTAQQLTQQHDAQASLQAALGDHAKEAGWMTGGLASNRLGYSITGTFDIASEPDTGRFCLSFSSINYTILHESTIYVASDFLKMGCRFSQTMAHERKHVHNYSMAAQRQFPAIRQALRAYMKQTGAQGPFDASERTAQVNRLYADAQAAVKPVIDKIIHDANAANDRMDNYDNYMRESAMCPGQFPKFDAATAVVAIP